MRIPPRSLPMEPSQLLWPSLDRLLKLTQTDYEKLVARVPVLQHARFGSLKPVASWTCVAVPLHLVSAMREKRIPMYMSMLDEAAVASEKNASDYVLAVLEERDSPSWQTLETICGDEYRSLPLLCGFQGETGARLVLDFRALYVTLKKEAVLDAFNGWCRREEVRFEAASPASKVVFRVGFASPTDPDVPTWLTAQKKRVEEQPWCCEVEYCVVPLPRK